MCVARELRNVRESLGMNQGEFGALIGYGRTSISDMEKGDKEIPDFVISKAVSKFNALGLALEKCQECSCNYFVPAKVDIDSSPVEVLDILIEEFEEGIQAAKKAKKELKLHNKRSREFLSEAEFRKLTDCTEQIYDPMTGIVKWLEVFQEKYKGNVKETKSKNITKLYDNGAKRKNSPVAADELKQYAY
ncbi:helix-turn-helix domain-containing protein [Orenia marismortui]|uniref:helix-turn-helix domain-containing protein n=1 Tax=Orenia marismortui TaxID=46469 RepID=UPI00037CBBDB|nr:helix-turn-helix transcriptional regulator [Orenia marismortui]